MMNISILTIRKIIEMGVVECKDVRVNTIERILGWRANTWRKAFTDETGLSPSNYIRLFRMCCISQDLRLTGMKFCQIAANHDRSVAYLTRDFKTHFGCTPQQFRNMPTIPHLELMKKVFGNVEFVHTFITCPPSIK